MEAKYKQIARALEDTLTERMRMGQTRLPSEAELCAQYGCSRQTIRAALELLQQNDLIIKVRGSGSFISSGVGRRRTVALLLPTVTEYVYPDMVREIRRCLERVRFDLVCFTTGGSAFQERALLESLVCDPPAGILMEAAAGTLPCLSEDLLRRLEELEVPVVYLNAGYSLPASAPKIAADERAGAAGLVDLLCRTGCRKILCVMQDNSSAAVERYTGCALSCLEHGVAFSESDVLWLNREERERLRSGDGSRLEAFLRRQIRGRSAIICGSDELAWQTTGLLEKLGISVPGEAAVAGFDNSYYAMQSSVPITSVGVAEGSVGAAAAEAMVQLLTGRKAASRLLPMKIWQRQSTGGPVEES